MEVLISVGSWRVFLRKGDKVIDGEIEVYRC